ncbi:amino acid ABC transporter permease [Propionivibrio sp.]|uniref:amino acid ABC transporter permease n=1 Tax=Propionivibrio sp. TaxID=2212460 RepID=UPI0039E50DF5
MIAELLADNLSYFLFGAFPEGGAMGGLLLTLWMSVLACLLASALGLAGGVALTMGGRRLRLALHAAIAVLRGVPVVMMIFWCYFLLPILFGLDVPGTATVITALAVINGAYLGLAVHAGLGAIDIGQWEASRALGLSRWLALRLVILPQGLRIMLPSFINQWVTLIKDTSLAFIVGVPELTMVAGQVNNREQVYPLPIFLFVAAAYFVICGGLSVLARKFEA